MVRNIEFFNKYAGEILVRLYEVFSRVVLTSKGLLGKLIEELL